MLLTVLQLLQVQRYSNKNNERVMLSLYLIKTKETNTLTNFFNRLIIDEGTQYRELILGELVKKNRKSWYRPVNNK